MARNSFKSICKLIDQVNDDIPVEQSFLADLKYSMEATNIKESRKPSQTYKPSSLGCIRSMYYQVIGVEPQQSTATYSNIGICNSGTDTHIRIQKAIDDMKNNGIECEYIDVAKFVTDRHLDYLDIVDKCGVETKLYHKDLNMSFMCDGIIKYKNHYYIVEFKTESSFKFTSRTYVDEYHFEQGTAYSIAFNLPEVLFIYINRDIFDMKSYLFVPTDEQKQSLIGKISNCDGYVQRKVCPPKPDNVSKKGCSYCSYSEQCKKDS